MDVLPVAAIVAVVLFVLKESLEAYRRVRADARKLDGIRKLLARECELNNWAVKSLGHILSELKPQADDGKDATATVEYARSGRIYIVVDSPEKGLLQKFALPDVHREQMSKFILDVATLDKNLFEELEHNYDAMSELEHVRESLLYHADPSVPEDLRDHLPHMAEYGLREIEDAKAPLASLYTHCTGKSLNAIRVR